MEQVLRQAWAFVFRDYHLTRRYMSWVVVFTFYAIVNSATIALIGVAAHDRKLTLTLLVGVLLWGFLSVLFNEIANSITYERWEGTLEYTFMAPVSRLIHLLGVSLFAVAYSIVRIFIVLAGLWLMIDLNLKGDMAKQAFLDVTSATLKGFKPRTAVGLTLEHTAPVK